MSAGTRSARLIATVLVGICLAAIATPSADAATGPEAMIGALAPPAVSLSGLASSLADPLSGGLDPLSSLSSDVAGVALDALGGAVLGGAGAALRETATVIDQTTAPRLESTWFSATYWRVASLGALLTLPFLFAAAVQALLRSDLTVVLRAAFGYLPLAMIGVSLAAPITLMLLSVTDEMSSVVAGAGAGGGVHFLRQTATEITGLSALDGSPFLGFALGFMMLAAALALAVEMLIREAAVYVVVLMLPLAFAALVWPARRTWAVRLVELLIALILSKFVIVAVLSLAGAAYGATGSPSTTRLLTAMALVMLSTFSPWVLLRLLPFTELAAGAGGAIRAELPRWSAVPKKALADADGAVAWAERLAQRLRPPSSDDFEAGDSGGSEAGLPSTDRTRYGSSGSDPGGTFSLDGDSQRADGEPAEPADGESAEPATGTSQDTRPAGLRLGLAPPGQEPDETTRPFLGRGGTVATSQEPQVIADVPTPLADDGALSPDLTGDSARDAAGISPADHAGISPAVAEDDPGPLPHSETPDGERL